MLIHTRLWVYSLRDFGNTGSDGFKRMKEFRARFDSHLKAFTIFTIIRLYDYTVIWFYDVTEYDLQTLLITGCGLRIYGILN